jgi:hypothetical protein
MNDGSNLDVKDRHFMLKLRERVANLIQVFRNVGKDQVQKHFGLAVSKKTKEHTLVLS